jgi:hypothetical protein
MLKRITRLIVAAGLVLGHGVAVAQGDGSDGVQRLSNSETGSATCGDIAVSWDNQRAQGVNTTGSARLRALDAAGAVLLDFTRALRPGERIVMLWCGDVLGDGSQALAYELFSGGAHCCFSVSVIQLAPGARHLLDADLGNGGLGPPQHLSDGGPLELVGSSDVFAYFDDLSFAASPFMPIIYAYAPDRGVYVESTSQFGDYLSGLADEAEAALGGAVTRTPAEKLPAALEYQEQESISLRLYGLHVLVGDADAALPRITARLSPTAAAWLRVNAADADAAMAGVYSLAP